VCAIKHYGRKRRVAMIIYIYCVKNRELNEYKNVYIYIYYNAVSRLADNIHSGISSFIISPPPLLRTGDFHLWRNNANDGGVLALGL